MHRDAFEHALLRASHLLVCSVNADLEEVLGILGEATGAESVFLVIVHWDESTRTVGIEEVASAELKLWHRRGEDGRREWMRRERFTEGVGAASPDFRGGWVSGLGRPGRASGHTVPIVAEEERFVGYLGIEVSGSTGVDVAATYGRILSLFGDLLASYFSRKIAEQALRESQERWYRLVDHNPHAILVVCDGRIVYSNAAGARTLGVPDTAILLGFSLRDFLSAEDFERVEENLRRAERGFGVPLVHEITQMTGIERIVESLPVPITFDGRAALQIVLQDITEWKESEERYSAFVETITEGVWRVDLSRPISVNAGLSYQIVALRQDAVLAECNGIFAQYLGARSRSAVEGRRLNRVLPGNSDAMLKAFIAGGYQLHGYELRVARPGRPTAFFLINAVGVVDRDRLVRVWGSCTEVTERVEMEHRIISVLEEQQERIGRDLHDSVGQLLTGIRILGDSLFAQSAGAPPRQREMLGKVVAYAQEASLTLRRIHRGLLPINLHHEGLAAALASLVDDLNGMPGPHCRFVHDGCVDVREAEMKLQLYRIVQEAVNNAVKHASAAEITITLAHEADAVCVEVRDDGVGFAQEHRPGSTLGLYSMQRRANILGGELSVVSGPGQGTLVRCVVSRAVAQSR